MSTGLRINYQNTNLSSLRQILRDWGVYCKPLENVGVAQRHKCGQVDLYQVAMIGHVVDLVGRHGVVAMYGQIVDFWAYVCGQCMCFHPASLPVPIPLPRLLTHTHTINKHTQLHHLLSFLHNIAYLHGTSPGIIHISLPWFSDNNNFARPSLLNMATSLSSFRGNIPYSHTIR